MTRLAQTKSICPVCLMQIPAAHVLHGDDVYLEKTCPEHGFFSTVIWRGADSYAKWVKDTSETSPQYCATQIDKGCPLDCGLCPDHRQRTCCVLLEITDRCNQRCAVCFADSASAAAEPSFERVREYMRKIFEQGLTFLQLSGGEPTVRDDLPDIVRAAKDIGFSYVQINSNGRRLAEEPDFTKALSDAGLSSVFMQFDGTRDDIYMKLRGEPLFLVKDKAVQQCAQHGLGVVLVPTLVPGVNTDNLGDIIRYGLSRAVRGVHFQPVSYFGRYMQAPTDAQRITLPEVLREIEAQTNGAICADQFAPTACYQARCGFHGDFVVMPDGSVKPLTAKKQETVCSCKKNEADDAVQKNRNFVAERWAGQYVCAQDAKSPESMGEWEVFLERVRSHSFAITGMLFQDCWNIDLERLKDCSLHVFGADGKIVPFCAYYLTDTKGTRLYHHDGWQK